MQNSVVNEKVMIRISKETKQRLKDEGAKKGLALASYIRMILTERKVDMKNKITKIGEFGMEVRVRSKGGGKFAFELAKEGKKLFDYESSDFDEGIDCLLNRALFELGPVDRARLLSELQDTSEDRGVSEAS